MTGLLESPARGRAQERRAYGPPTTDVVNRAVGLGEDAPTHRPRIAIDMEAVRSTGPFLDETGRPVAIWPRCIRSLRVCEPRFPSTGEAALAGR